MDQANIAQKYEVDQSTVSRWMDRHDVEARHERVTHSTLPRLRQHQRGYQYWEHGDQYVYVHRLVAVAHYGLKAVAGQHVHHRNDVPWDNRFENLEVLDAGQHHAKHRGTENALWKDPERLKRLLERHDTLRAAAEDAGCTHSNLIYWREKHDLEA
jgi:transposase-like protein